MTKETFKPNPFLKKNKINIVTIIRDNDSSMAEIRINNKSDYVGNYWDYHPGCHGIRYLGDFNGPHDYVASLINYYSQHGFKFGKIINKKGTWVDSNTRNWAKLTTEEDKS